MRDSVARKSHCLSISVQQTEKPTSVLFSIPPSLPKALSRLSQNTRNTSENSTLAEKPRFSIEPLSSEFNRTRFTCGTEALDRYCREQMGQDARRNLAIAYVLLAERSTEVSGFYTLSCTGIPTGDLPEDIRKRIPYELAPAILLGRFALAHEAQGQKLGKLTLLDALKRSWELSKSIAATGVVVDAKDEDTAGFYEHMGFIRFPENPRRLYLPMKTIEQLFSE
jgi:GNAT superfamily N-acetyltransferase